MQSLSNKHKLIHARAVELSQKYLRLEWDLIQILREVEKSKLYKLFDKPSLFRYSVEVLNLSEAVTYSLITLARKSAEVPALAEALARNKITASKASRIVAALSAENASELIEFASRSSARAIDFEVARRNPQVRRNDKVKPVGEDQVELTITVSKSTFEKMKRAESLIARTQSKTSLSDTVAVAIDILLDRKDPVRKAERASRKKKSTAAPVNPAQELCTYRVSRKNLTTAQKHAVFARDQGKCTHRDSSSQVCGSDRWIDIHHIIPVSRGGSNDPSNLTTLCSFHHDLVHQLEMPIDGGVSWLREPFVEYSVR